MNFSKKIIHIFFVIALSLTIENKAMAQPTYSGDSLNNHQLEIALLTTVIGLLGVIGIQDIFKGVLDAFSIPLTPLENIALALRNNMSKEDYKKHKLGNKIKSAAEIIIGLGFLLNSFILWNALAQEVKKLS